MKVFLSHAAKDKAIAVELAGRMREAGLEVVNPYEEIVPGDNWAEKVAEALENSDAMLILLTPGAIQSDFLQNDLSYALGSKRFRNRLMTVIVGAAVEAPGDVPWILLRQPHKQVASPAEFGEVVEEMAGLVG